MINSQNNKKIKVFLGAYVNFPNAQNINCDNIARYLDKDKFEVHVMYTNKMPIDKDYYSAQNVHLHKLIHHRYIWYWSKLLVMLFSHCDIYYLPKMEEPDKAFIKAMRGRTNNAYNNYKGPAFVSSVEGVITENSNNTNDIRQFHESMDSVLSISNCIRDSADKYWGMKLPVIPLGVVEKCHLDNNMHDSIRTVIWVGNIKSNKRPQWLVEIAKCFPRLDFIMIGDGDMQDEIDGLITAYGLHNIKRTGRVTNDKVYEYMARSDLLLMTSEYEGLPKVIQEAAQCGVPSIYIAQNYTVDFIEDGINGFEVYDLKSMKERISYLISNPEKYSLMSAAATDSIKPYLWPVLIKQYEDYFESLVNTKDER